MSVRARCVSSRDGYFEAGLGAGSGGLAGLWRAVAAVRGETPAALATARLLRGGSADSSYRDARSLLAASQGQALSL
jgi:hypothetical protein